MADKGGVDERRDWVGGEREHGGRGDADDVRRNPVKPEPPQHPTQRAGLRLLVILPPSPGAPWCLLLDDVRDDRLPFTAASRATPPWSCAAGAETAVAAWRGEAIDPWMRGSYKCGGYRPRGRRRGRRHGRRRRASVWSQWCGSGDA